MFSRETITYLAFSPPKCTPFLLSPLTEDTCHMVAKDRFGNGAGRLRFDSAPPFINLGTSGNYLTSLLWFAHRTHRDGRDRAAAGSGEALHTRLPSALMPFTTTNHSRTLAGSGRTQELRRVISFTVHCKGRTQVQLAKGETHTQNGVWRGPDTQFQLPPAQGILDSVTSPVTVH